MLRQITYFQSVVQNNSFSKAAEECHISQSAISQQIKALENSLGFSLLERKNRKFFLTPAGEHFYKKSLILTADYEQMCREAAKIAHGSEAVLKAGCLRSCGSQEFRLSLAEFSDQYPHVSIQPIYGNHEELFTALRNGEADLVFNDQRRAFSDEYVNLVLSVSRITVEISARNAISALPSVTAKELKNIPCILVTSRDQQETEREYYQTVTGIQSSFLFAENLEEARLLAISGQGFLPVLETGQTDSYGPSLCRIPLYRSGSQMTQNLCLFWKKDNSGYYVEEFADILKSKFV